MIIKQSINKCLKKAEVYTYYRKGTFDKKDSARLKPFTRLRESVDEVKKYESGDIKTRIKDWYYNIDKGYAK